MLSSLETYPSTTGAVERGDRKHPHEYDFQATKAKSGKPMKILEGLATFENGFELALAWQRRPAMSFVPISSLAETIPL